MTTIDLQIQFDNGRILVDAAMSQDVTNDMLLDGVLEALETVVQTTGQDALQAALKRVKPQGLGVAFQAFASAH
jgi:ABC-type xylose transport system substrate-binding protein